MAELLKTLFQSYSHSVLLSHLYQKKVLLTHHSHFLNLPLTLTLPHALNLALTLPHALNLPLSHIAH